MDKGEIRIKYRNKIKMKDELKETSKFLYQLEISILSSHEITYKKCWVFVSINQGILLLLQFLWNMFYIILYAPNTK